MNWQERIFKKSYNYISNSILRKVPATSKTVYLSDIKNELILLATALTGEVIEIIPTKNEGGWVNNYFFLPHKYHHTDTIKKNHSFYLYRIFYLSLQKQLQLNWSTSAYNQIEAQEKAQEQHQTILKELFRLYPKYLEIYTILEQIEQVLNANKNIPLALLHGRLLPPLQKINTKNKKIARGQFIEKEEQEVQQQTERKVENFSHTKSIEVDEQAQDDAVLQHQFEKVETLEEFKGSWRDMDGSDEMEEHEDALKNVEMSQTVRIDTPVHSIYQTDFLLNTSVKESQTVNTTDYHLEYDEWNYSKRIYRKNYCSVYPKSPKASSSAYVKNSIKKNKKIILALSKQFNQIQNELSKVNKQIDGEDLDLDSVVANFSNIKAGVTPNERIYASKKKNKKALSIIVLIDSSLSSDSYTQGKKILDIEKEAVISFGEVLEKYDANFQIDAFSSKTRNYCEYFTFKKFNENWNPAKNKIGAHKASGYTRIGPAIRHASSLLQEQQGAHKWIILLSDGKPNDYDKYEGFYGIEDVKKALQEAENKGIFTHALAIDKKAKYYLPKMFGYGAYTLLPNIDLLPYSLANFFNKITLNR